MILSKLQLYLAERDRASLEELTLRFHTDAAALRPMLTRLMRKGRVRQLPSASKCSGCCTCSAERLELYEWIGNSSSQPPSDSTQTQEYASNQFL